MPKTGQTADMDIVYRASIWRFTDADDLANTNDVETWPSGFRTEASAQRFVDQMNAIGDGEGTWFVESGVRRRPAAQPEARAV